MAARPPKNTCRSMAWCSKGPGPAGWTAPSTTPTWASITSRCSTARPTACSIRAGSPASSASGRKRPRPPRSGGSFTNRCVFRRRQRPVQVVVKKRDGQNAFREVWSVMVDPADPAIDRSRPARQRQGVGGDAERRAARQGGPAADGRRLHRRARWRSGTTTRAAWPICCSPSRRFKERRDDFNVWAVDTPADESGVSRPSDGIYRRSPLRAAYDAFGSERYVLTFDNKRLREAASAAPLRVHRNRGERPQIRRRRNLQSVRHGVRGQRLHAVRVRA